MSTNYLIDPEMIVAGTRAAVVEVVREAMDEVDDAYLKLAGEMVAPTARGGFRGIASAKDEVDCVGDRMLSYAIPESKRVPLLMGHDPSVPIGDALLSEEGPTLMAELLFPPPGTSVASDEARRLVESGVARLSIGFSRRSKGTANNLGGVDWDPAHVIEVSIVGAGCLASAGVPSGKAATTSCGCSAKNGDQAVLSLIPSPKAAPQITPEMIAAATAAAVREAVREQVIAATGSIDGERRGRPTGVWSR